MHRRRIVRELLETAYALMVTYAIGKWAIYAAYLERGYEAVGGEYCLILMTYWAAWKAIGYLFDTLEDLQYERFCKKRRGRTVTRKRDNG